MIKATYEGFIQYFKTFISPSSSSSLMDPPPPWWMCFGIVLPPQKDQMCGKYKKNLYSEWSECFWNLKFAWMMCKKKCVQMLYSFAFCLLIGIGDIYFSNTYSITFKNYSPRIIENGQMSIRNYLRVTAFVSWISHAIPLSKNKLQHQKTEM